MSYVARSPSREYPRVLRARKETGRGCWIRSQRPGPPRQMEEAWWVREGVRAPPQPPGKIIRELRARWRVMRRRRGVSQWSPVTRRRARRVSTSSRRRSASSPWITPSRRPQKSTGFITRQSPDGWRSRRRRTNAQTLGIFSARKVMARRIGSELHLNISPKSATFLIWSIKLNESSFNLLREFQHFPKQASSSLPLHSKSQFNMSITISIIWSLKVKEKGKWLLIICRGWQVHLLAAGLPGGWAAGVAGPGQGQGHGDPHQPRPGRRGEDMQVVPPLAQQVDEDWDRCS